MDIILTLISLYLLIPSTYSNWSSWSTWSECSRTCNGGISNQMRRCLAPSRKQCLGDEIRYRTCNHEEACPKEDSDFRSEQCNAFNDIKYKGEFYQWIPVYDKYDPCALICDARDHRLTVVLSPKVLDGTRCDQHSKDVCVNGLCKSVGCDNGLNSKKVDECGVCGGDGSTCNQIEITEEQIIPLHRNTDSGRTSKHSTYHPLQQRNLSTRSLVNNRNGVLSNVSHEDSMMNDGDSHRNDIVRANRPYIAQSVEVQLYDWVESPFSDCSATCGEGKQQTTVKCINSRTQEVSPDQFCRGPKTPHRARVCLLKSCGAKWIVGKWDACSTTCGGGISVRNVFCVTVGKGGKIEKTDDFSCLRKRPPTKEKCNSRPCPHWQPGQWSVCSVKCGVGDQFRPSVCKKYTESDVCPDTDRPTEKQKCHTGVLCVDKVADHQDFNNKPFVSGPSIKESNEGEHIIEDDRSIGEDNHLQLERRPDYNDFDSREYNFEKDNEEYYRGNFDFDDYSEEEENNNQLNGRDVNAEVDHPFYDRGDKMMESVGGSGDDNEVVIIDAPSFHTGKWGECDVSCGKGNRRRTVECSVENTNFVKRLSDSMCEDKKPEDTQPCEVECDKRFHTEDWSQCDVTCGHGQRHRKVECRVFVTYSNSIQVLADSSCSGSRPADTEECIEENCPIQVIDGVSREGYAWQFAGYQPCSVTCGGGFREPTFACVRPDPNLHITVDKDMCSRLPLPTVLIGSCNEFSCPGSFKSNQKPRWRIYDYGPCSHHCGGGLQQRQVDCVRDEGDRVPERLCLEAMPAKNKLCNLVKCPPAWMTGTFSKCSVTCGKGIMTTNVTCQEILPPVRKHVILNEAYCQKATKPRTTEPCVKQPCVRTPIMRADKSYYVQLQTRKHIRFSAGGTLVVIPGTVLRLRCPVSNFDRTKIVWTKNGEVVTRKGRVKRSKRGVLNIRGGEMIDAGVYTCHAGELSATTRLRFHRESTALDKYLFRESANARDPEFLEEFRQKIKQTGSNKKEEYTEPYLLKHFDQYELPFRFIASKWGSCSRNCGGAGLQSRQITCELNLDHYYLVVGDEYCVDIGLDKPLSTQDCGFEVCPEWEVGVWSDQCSDEFCLAPGIGGRKRPIFCVSQQDKTPLDQRMCDQSKKPKEIEKCAMASCVPKWTMSAWTSCSRSCGGEGIRTRSLQCVWEPNNQRAHDACKYLDKPNVMMPCDTAKCDYNSCRDDSHYCSVVQMLNMCRYSEYRTKCCASCTAIGRGPIIMLRNRRLT